MTAKGTSESKKELLSDDNSGSRITAPIPQMENVNTSTHSLTGAFLTAKATPATRNAAIISTSVNVSINVNNFSRIN